MFRIDNEKFGTFVSQLRKERGMTQKDLAERLFVSDKAVSKWERGLSLPDISLLQPMADILGVSLTELLSGQYIRKDAAPTQQDEEELLLSTVAKLTWQEEETQRQNRRRWGRIYAAALLCGILEMLLLWSRLWDSMAAFMLLPPVMGAVFGVHFCFFATEKLPAFYDQYRLNFYSEGMFRMNLPGVRFNNSNWPHILHALRIWCTAMMALWVPVYGVLHGIVLAILPEFTASFIMLFLFFPVFFGGLFGPVFVQARKYE